MDSAREWPPRTVDGSLPQEGRKDAIPSASAAGWELPTSKSIIGRQTLHKQEILRKKSLASILFREGKSLKGDFLRMVYLFPVPQPFAIRVPYCVMFAVGKKVIPSAVKRNRVKRMMREAWRLEKPLLCAKAAEAASMAGSCGNAPAAAVAMIYAGRGTGVPSLGAFRREIRRLSGSMRLPCMPPPRNAE